MKHRRSPAFTLIEMLGVLAIMALLSAAATVMLSGSRHAADMHDAIEQFQQADISVRTLSKNADRPVTLVISLPNGRMARTNQDAMDTLGSLPSDVKIERVRKGSSTIDYGSAAIAFNAGGRSDSYAIKLVNSARQRQWIIFAGLTGQMSEVNDDEIDQIFEQISTGFDAH